MKESKKFSIVYIACLILFMIFSIWAGIKSYGLAVKNEEAMAKMPELEWLIPMGQTYSYFDRGNIDSDIFMGVERNRWARCTVFDKDGHMIGNAGYLLTDIWPKISKGLFTFEKNGSDRSYGVKDSKGKIVIPAKLPPIEQFDDGYGLAYDEETGNDLAFNRKGEIVLQTTSKNMCLHQIKGPLFMRESNNQLEVIDLETEKIVFESSEYSHIDYGGEGYYIAQIANKESMDSRDVLLDSGFAPITDQEWIQYGEEFSEGYCYVEGKKGNVIQNGYIDQTGELVIPTGNSLCGAKFSEGKALVSYKDKIVCIDEKGKPIFELILEKKTTEGNYWAEFCHDRAVISIGEKKGLIDSRGRWILKPVFKHIDIIDGDLISLTYGTRSGVAKIGGERDADQDR